MACAHFDRPGTAGVAGIVRESDGVPVPYATVSFDGGYLSTTVAERTGCFVLRAPERKELTLLTRRIGFHEVRQALDLHGDSTVFVDVRLSPIVVTLDGVVTTAARDEALAQSGFYDRLLDRKKGVGDGWFITPEDIERRHAGKITDLMEGYPSIRMIHGVNRGIVLPTGNGGGCIMAVYLDGGRIMLNAAEGLLGSSVNERVLVTAIANDQPLGYTSGGNIAVVGEAKRAFRTESLDDLVGPTSIAAIEMYPRGPPVPPQYQLMNGSCGVILIWTKR